MTASDGSVTVHLVKSGLLALAGPGQASRWSAADVAGNGRGDRGGSRTLFIVLFARCYNWQALPGWL